MNIRRRPDPAHGVFETLLVVAGRPIELDAHMARLGASLETLFGPGLPAGARDLVLERSAGIDLGRLRLTVAPLDGGLGHDVVAREIDPALFFPAPQHGAELRGLPFAGGLGSHKWADRSPLQGAAPGPVPLLLDRGDEVLEAGWANVFAARDGALVTPRTDGRILPGIARAGAIEVARAAGIEVRELRLGRDELLAADEVFLTGSVRGVAPAGSLDGAALPEAGELSRLVGDALRRRWTSAPVAAAPPEHAAAPPPGPPAR
jgi:para-aminobenzoate synthetase / 4-amino-4-deoxychorismate lyase